MNRKRKSFFISIAAVLVAIATLIGITGNKYVSFPVITNAEQNSQSTNNLTTGGFPAVNQLAKTYKANPTIENARGLADKSIELVSILEIPEFEKTQIIEQIAVAHLNGSSDIPEANIVIAINDLASRADAPDFAYTSSEQVEVTRKYLNRLAPDLVSANGGMTDIEAFVVFVGLLSQKIDNEDFMVVPSQFTENMNNITGNGIPGRPEDNGEVEITEESSETYQMLQAISNYTGSKNALSSSDVITMIGIN